MRYKRYPERIFWQLVTSPFIFLMIVPFVILDIFLEMYHHICFRAYKIPLVKRRKYIRFDRHKLEYLGFWSKLFCMYCSYANGLIHYTQVIGGETEKYWCGIRHNSENKFMHPPHHEDFLEYGDHESYSKYTRTGRNSDKRVGEDSVIQE